MAKLIKFMTVPDNDGRSEPVLINPDFLAYAQQACIMIGAELTPVAMMTITVGETVVIVLDEKRNAIDRILGIVTEEK